MRGRFSFLIFFFFFFFLFYSTPVIANEFDSTSGEGELGNSEVKFYSGDLSLRIELPSWKTFGEETSLNLTYRSGTVDATVGLIEEHEESGVFDFVHVVGELGNRSVQGNYEGLSGNNLGKNYVYKVLMDTRGMESGFYKKFLGRDYYEGYGLCPACSRWFGVESSFFGGYRVRHEQRNGEIFVLNTQNSVYGAGWFLSMDNHLYESPDSQTVAVVRGDGSHSLYKKDGSDVYRGLGSAYGTIRGLAGGGWELTEVNGTKSVYLRNGLLEKTTDRLKRTYAYHYTDSNGVFLLTEITDPLNRKITFEYDENNKLTSITDIANRTTRFVINKKGNLIGVIYPDQTQIKYAYDGRHHLTEKISARGGVTKYYFDEYGKIKEVTDAEGNSRQYNLAFSQGAVNTKNETALVKAGEFKSTLTDALGVAREYYFKKIPLVWKKVDGLKRITLREHNERAELVREVWANGNVVTYQYNNQGKPIFITNEGNQGQTKISYNFYGQPIQIEDGENRTSFNYDTNGNIITYRNGAGEETHYSYDDNNLLSKEETPTGNIYNYSYTENGELKNKTDSTNRRWAYGYDAYGNLTEETNPSGIRHTNTYDTMNRLIREEEDGKLVKEYGYKEPGCDCEAKELVSTTRDANGRETKYSYDKLGQLTKITNELGQETKYSTNANRKLSSQTDSLNRTRNYTYDFESELIEITEPNGHKIKLAYTDLGNLKTLTDAKDQTTHFNYDAAGRLIKEEDAEGATTHYTYNSSNQLIQTQNLDGSIIDYQYDGAGRLTLREGKEKNKPETELTRFIYSHGQLIQAINEDARIDRSYDPAGRLTQETTHIHPVESAKGRSAPRTFHGAGGPTHTINYAYTNMGLAETKFGDEIISYDYNERDFLKGIRTKEDTIALSYDILGRRTQMTINNELIKRYAYDQGSRLTELNYAVDGKDLFSQKLNYNVVNNITQNTINNQTQNYEYDDLDQITTAQGPQGEENFYYDKAGNHLFNAHLKQAQYTRTNQLISIPDQAAFAYDQMGRLKTVVDLEKEIDLNWNSRSLVTQADVNGKKIRYLYDPFRRRIGKIFSDGRKEFYGYDRENIVAVYDESGKIKRTFLHGPDIDEVLLARSGDQTNYYVTNYLGSVTQVLSADLKLVATYSYNAFGTRKTSITQPGKVLDTSYGYTSREHDAETGLMYYRNRYYIADARRFVSRDPIGFAGGLNVYGYVGNSPLNWIDPWGLDGIYVDYSGYPINTGYGFNLPLGHSAAIAVDPNTGATRYYEYGRYDKAQFGLVRNQWVPNLVITDGNPTEKSLANLYKYISKHYGHDRPVDAQYYSDADYQKIVDFALERMNNKNRDPYSMWNNNCKTFARDAIEAGRK